MVHARMSQKPQKVNGKNADDSKLKKELGLFDVYCIATGAMISSGFFLLPGLAAAMTGPSAVLAYLVAGLLMIPSMLCILELSTALPRAGGAYYFLDRSMGPGVGTVAGIGTWLALVLKSAFALVGMGAYLAITPGLENYLSVDGASTEWLIKMLAVVLTFVFVGVNIIGAKESMWLQKLLVVAILGVLVYFAVEGLWHIFGRTGGDVVAEQYTPFFHPENGFAGLASTVGLVFISFAGLTHVASVSEEVRQPERTLPLAVILSLATATLVYVVGVFILIAVLEPDVLHRDFAPVATAAYEFAAWMPGWITGILITVAALAAFISTGNAGILSASRYPLAMARDRLLPPRLEKLGRFRTPTPAILLTGAAMIISILALSTEGVAKVGSTFNLLVFALVNLAVIVMRESRIETYDPGFKVPLYPWVPLFGVVVSGWLIYQMGWLTTVLSLAVIAVGAVWYWYYGRARVERYGAIHHVFARLGRYRHPQLNEEFREIVKEKGLREEDPYDQLISEADLLDVTPGTTYEEVVHRAARLLAKRVAMEAQEIEDRFRETGGRGDVPLSRVMALVHFRDDRVEHSAMVMVRAEAGIEVALSPEELDQPAQSQEVFALFLLISPEEKPGQHLRILTHLAERVEDETFAQAWRRLRNPHNLKQALLRASRFLELLIRSDQATGELVGKRVLEVDVPPGAFVAMLRRGDDLFEPKGATTLEDGDYLTLIGEPAAIDRLAERYVPTDEEDEKDEKDEEEEKAERKDQA